MRSVPYAPVALPLTLWSAVLAGGCRTAGAPGAAEPRLPSTMGGAETRADGRLPNGVRVVVEENHAAPVVAIQVWVAGGAAGDPPELAGSAHFFEHLLYRGTKRRAPGAAAREVEGVGGALGAWTGPDETVYHAVVAAPYFELGLDVLGDALTSPRFDAEEIERARRIILDEIAGGRADPARVGSEALLAAAFPGHGYGRPLLGMSAVAARTPAELAARFAQSYVGAALTVVVSGDVEAAAARAAVGRAFAGVPSGRAAVGAGAVGGAPRPAAVARWAARDRKNTEAAAELLFGFRTPAPSPEDAAALDLLGAVLARGDASRLDREVVRNRSLAERVRAFTFCSRAAGLLAFALPVSPRRTDAAVEAALDVALRLAREEVTADELGRARVELEADLARGEAGVEGRARRLGFAAAVAGDLDWGDRYRAKLGALVPSELRAAAAKVFRADALSVAVVLPESATAAPADADAAVRTRLEAVVAGAERRAERVAVAGGPATPIAGGDVVRFVDPSGLRLLALRDPGARLVTIEAAWAGSSDGDGNGATAALIAALLGRGTRTRSAADIAAELRRVGGGIEGFAAPGVMGVRLEMLPSAVDRGLALLADCLLHPSFPEDELDRERRALVERLRSRPESDAAPASALRLFRETLGPEHPRPPDPDAVSSLGRVRLLDRYRRAYPPGRMVVAIVGDVPPATVVASASALLGGAAGELAPPRASSAAHPPGAPAAPPAIAPATAPSTVEPTTVFRTSTRSESEAVVGYPTFAPGDPDRLALELLAEILSGEGGRFARLFSDDKALALRTSARAAPVLEPGYLAVALTCAPARLDAAVAAVRGALANVAAAGVTAEEVSRAARRLVGARAAALRSRAAIAHALVVDEARGLPPLAYRQEPTTLARLGADDVARAARRAFDPAHEVIAVVTGSGK